MIINDLYNNKKTAVLESQLNPGEDEYYFRVRHQTKRDIELEMPPKAWDSVGPEYATYEEAQVALKALQAKHPNERFTYTQHPRISNMGGKPHRVFPEGVAEGDSRHSYENNYVILDPDGKVKAIKQNLEKARRWLLKLEKQFGPGYKIRPVDNMKNIDENMADDIAAAAQKKFPNAYISKDGEEVQKPKNWGKRYTPPAAAPADLEKQQRDLTAKYPNIDELVRKAELNRDPDYEMADGQAYYTARDAEQNYQKLRQIQRVIQGLNESLDRSHLP
jgi:hypothetical protein